MADVAYTKVSKTLTSAVGESTTGVSTGLVVSWGNIIGTLSNQTDLQAALDLKFDLAGPFQFDNILIATNTISSTNTNGDIYFAPNGLGVTKIYTGTDEALRMVGLVSGNPLLTWYQTTTRRAFISWNAGDSNYYIANEYGGVIIKTGVGGGDISHLEIDSSGNVDVLTGTLKMAGNAFCTTARAITGTYLRIDDIIIDGSIISASGVAAPNIILDPYGGTGQVQIWTDNDEMLRLRIDSADGSPYISFWQSSTVRSTISYEDTGDAVHLQNLYGPIHFYTGDAGGSNRVVTFAEATNLGLVGINAASPVYPLQIENGGGNVIVGLGTNAAGITGIRSRGVAGSTASRDFDIEGNDITFTTCTTDEGTSFSSRMIVRHTTGRVGIGTLTPSQLLDVNGASNFTGNMTVTGSVIATGEIEAWDTSDIKLKSNIKPISGERALQALLSWRTISYDREDKNRSEVGLIAQEVGKDFPELVRKDQSGNLMLHYGKLDAIIVAAIKELYGRTNNH